MILWECLVVRLQLLAAYRSFCCAGVAAAADCTADTGVAGIAAAVAGPPY